MQYRKKLSALKWNETDINTKVSLYMKEIRFLEYNDSSKVGNV